MTFFTREGEAMRGIKGKYFERQTQKSRRYIRLVYCKALRFLRKGRGKPVIDKSQFYELERLQMENFPSVRDFEMALAEFQRTRCE